MHDLRYAIRLIAQNWAFSLTVIVILALCIGANTAVLSVVNAAMVRPLAYPEPDRLAQITVHYKGGGLGQSHDGRTWEAVRDSAPALDSAVYSDWVTGVNIGVNGGGAYVKQQRVCAGFFRVLGVAPALGREFNATEDRAGGPAAVLLSNAVWKKYFNGDPGVVGRGILLRGEPHTVVGVMPAGFRSDIAADLWTPIRPSRSGEGGGNNYGIVGRLRPGTQWQQAAAQLAGIAPNLVKQSTYLHEGDRLDMMPLLAGMTSDLRKPLMMLWAAVAVIFVLGCVNIGGMLLARSSGRVGEIATRLALGAPFARIARQLLVESTVLGLIGGAAGVLVGWAGLEALRALGSGAFSFLETVNLDWRVLAATLALTLIAGLVFGLVPAWQASRVDLRSAQTGARGIAGRKRFISLGGMVGGQVALTVPLLVGAGLLLRTFLYLWNLNPGFDPNHVLTARFSLEDARYNTAQKMNQLFDKALERLHETPGIQAAAVSLSLPYERGLNTGVRLPNSANSRITNMVYVTPEFFSALRIPLLQGRAFTNGDTASSARVAVVNRAFANLYFKDQSPLGQPIGLGPTSNPQIVGVVGDIQQRPGWEGFEPIAPVPAVYVPATQTNDKFLQLVHGWFSPNWIVRGSLSGPQMIAAIENATRSADPLLPMAEFRSVTDLKIDSLRIQRLLAALVGALAGLAIILATLGIYGLISNLVTERTRELGIRLALGSSVSQAAATALRPGLIWVLAGVLSGTAIAIMLERLLKSFLWGVRSTDPLTLLCVAAGLLLATSLASLIPAMRIVRLNPGEVLKGG
jgi:predicted permease